MKLWHLASATMALGFACNSSEDNPIPVENANGSGTIQLALTGVDSKGNEYRLRDGEFRIAGYPELENGAGGDSSYYEETVSTEDDPDAPVITKRVIPGYYYVEFTSQNWYFEKFTPQGPERVEKAVLLSSRYTSGYVYDDRETKFRYQFGVNGEAIDFRGGDITIQIGIELPEDTQGWSGAGAGGEPGIGFGGAGGSAG